MERNYENLENIEMENAKLLRGGFMNFSGAVSKYNVTGDKYFHVVIPDELGEKLKADGWNIKILRPRDEDDKPTYHLKVTVSFKYDRLAPQVYLVTKHNRVRLDDDTIGQLDGAVIENVDLIIRPRHWTKETKDGIEEGIKAYLKTMYVTIEEDPFAAKYSQY